MSERLHNMFCKGHPLGFHRIPIGISLATPVILQQAPLRINFVLFMHFCMGSLTYNFIGSPFILKEVVVLKISMDFHILLKGTLGFHRVSICLQGGRPLGPQDSFLWLSCILHRSSMDYPQDCIGSHLFFARGPTQQDSLPWCSYILQG